MITISRGSKPDTFTVELDDGKPQAIEDMSAERARQVRDGLVLLLGLPEGAKWVPSKKRGGK